MRARQRTGFPSPFEVTIPPDCEGWEEMYARHVVFGEARRGFEEGRFWFQDGLHAAEPLYPFDSFLFEYAVVAMNQASSRLFVVPPSLGVECRLLNGYVYLSANPVTDEATLERRAELFAGRAGHYYEHWDELYERWLEKVEAATTELVGLEVPEMPEVEDESIVTDGRGLGSSHALLHAYDRLLEGVDRIFQYHFEFLGLGYGAYLAFYERCRERFPDISDQTIAKMVSAIDVLVLRPDDELRRLARLAVELGVSEQVASADERGRARREPSSAAMPANGGSPTSSRRRTRGSTSPAERASSTTTTARGSTTPGSRSRRSAPTSRDSTPARTSRVLAELRSPSVSASPRSTARCSRRSCAEAFDESLALARTVFPYVENHHFYIDHRYFTIFWNKVREFGALLARVGFLADGEDVFLLRHDEVRSALEALRLDWSSGGAGVPHGPLVWPPLVERRRAIYHAMCAWAQPPALGPLHEEITDPISIMLWGITDERVRDWLSSDGDEAETLTGCPASPGVAEGLARVLLRVDQLGELEDGEILVAPVTSPSWTPVFHRIAGAVLDTGGIMCHAAIVAREYGLPAVVGTGTGTKRIRSGDRLRVDATTGVVTILERAPV